MIFNVFRRFWTFFVVLGPFLRSWRPKNASKGFLKVVRFISTEYEPVGRHVDPKRIHFHNFLDHSTVLDGCGALIGGCGALTDGCGALTDGCGALVDGCGALTDVC